MMKKLLLAAIFLMPSLTFAQWSTTGNALASAGKLGSTNNQTISVITNNTERMSISGGGVWKINMLSGTGNALFQLASDGTASRLNFSGNASDVLTGAGSFSSINTVTGWTNGGGITYTMGKLGVGVSNPVLKAEIDGSLGVTGSVYATNFIAADASMVQGQLSFAGNMYVTGYDPIAGTRNEVHTSTQPYYIQSAPGYNLNTVLNHGNSGNVGIGTDIPNAKLTVDGTLSVSGESNFTSKARFNRITSNVGDSLLRFGDSTILYNLVTNCIYGSPSASAFTVNKGLGLGSYAANGKGKLTVAVGYQSHAYAEYSYTLGNFVKTDASATKAIAIGSGVSGASLLVNNITNSLMIGFNSDKPTMFVSPASGTGTTGAVGIATTCIPTGFKLAVNGKIMAERVIVKEPNGSGCWPDYVFESGYKPMSLEEISTYVFQHKHLPGIPSEAQVNDEGLDLFDFSQGLLKITEENTLHMIQLKKENEDLKQELSLLKKRLEQIEKAINK